MPKSKYLQYVIFCGFLQLFSYVIFLRQHIDQWVGNLPLIYCLFCYRAWDEPRFWWSISWYNKCISGAKMSFTWFRSCAEVRRLRINLRFAPDVNGALLPSLPSIFPSLLSDQKEWLRMSNIGLVGLWLMLIVDFVSRACSWRPYLRLQLQQICEQYFEWSPEKTGTLEIPKIISITFLYMSKLSKLFP